MAKKEPLYPHVPKSRRHSSETEPTREADEERRKHARLCRESCECLEKVKGFMWQIEVERAKRYGRIDPLAVKANEVLWEIRKQLEKVIEMEAELGEKE